MKVKLVRKKDNCHPENNVVKLLEIIIAISILYGFQSAYAGPPFNTDDPEPLDLKHWEYYLSTISTFHTDKWSGTLPHAEVNYGIFSNAMVHLLLPVNYIYMPHGRLNIGYASTELGFKYRFVQETNNRPQIGTFPILEIPTVKNSDFNDGKVQVYIPVWIQKSWDKFITYGGAGYWINPGTNSRNWVFTGWEAQYDFSKVLTLGGEIYFQSPDVKNGKPVTAFNLGGYIHFSSEFNIIFSFGHSIFNDRFFTSYTGLYWTI